MTLGIDPVIPKALDGLCAEVELDGHPVRVRYRVAAKGCGPIALTLNGHTLPMTREDNPYRTAGVTVPMARVYEHLCAGMTRIQDWKSCAREPPVLESAWDQIGPIHRKSVSARAFRTGTDFGSVGYDHLV